MRKIVLAAMAAVVAGVGAPASAAITYSFMSGENYGPTDPIGGFGSYFILTTANFIRSNITFQQSQFTYCGSENVPCLPGLEPSYQASFSPAASYYLQDYLNGGGMTIQADLIAATGDGAMTEAFVLGAFTHLGTYRSLDTQAPYIAQLTVAGFEDDPAPVPEPATWALLLTGFAVIAAILRRIGCRATDAEIDSA